jgi:hypothetical protein
MAVALAAAAGVVILVAVGMLERSHEQSYMRGGIGRVRAAIGPSLSRPGPTNYLYAAGRTCLLWAAAGRSYGLELCVDPRGRVVEAVDRRGGTSTFYSLVEEPGAAKLYIAPTLFLELVAELKSPAA